MNSREINPKVGKALKQIRESKGLSQMDLCQLLPYHVSGLRSGITPLELTRIECDEVKVSIDTLKRLLTAMGSNFADLYDLLQT